MVPTTSKIRLGYRTDTGALVRLSLAHIATHLHILGGTGSGKTRFLAHLVLELLRKTDWNVLLIDPKGDLYDLVLRATISNGFKDELVLFDMAERRAFLGYDPLRANALDRDTHVQFVLEAIHAAWGQQAFDQFPQLLRNLYIALTGARVLDLGLAGTLELLRPASVLRPRAIERLPDGFVRNELVDLHRLSAARQEERTASAVARLGPFVGHTAIAARLHERDRALDLDHVLYGPRRQALLINLATVSYADRRLLGRFLVNDALTHRLRRGRDPHVRPTVLVVDELGDLITPDLVRALDWGRSLSFWVVGAHQYLEQLRQEGELLERAFATDARGKVFFGGTLVDDILRLKEFSIQEWNPKKIKDELKTFCVLPREERRQSVTVSASSNENRAHAASKTKTTQRGTNTDTTIGLSHAEHEAHGTHSVHVEHESEAEADGESESSSSVSLMGGSSAQFTGIDGLSPGLTEGFQWSDGFGSGNATHRMRSNAHGTSDGEGESEIEGKTTGASIAYKQGQSQSEADTTGETITSSAGKGAAVAIQDAPFVASTILQQVSTRTFESYDEFALQVAQRVHCQPEAHATVKVAAKPLRSIRTARFPDPAITDPHLYSETESLYATSSYRQGDPLAIDITPTTPPADPRRDDDDGWMKEEN